MASLRIKDQKSLQTLFQRVEILQENTPFSFSQLPELQLIVHEASHDDLVKVWKSLESLDCLPLLPTELFYYCFPDECECSNPKCLQSLTYKKSLAGNFLPTECTSVCQELALIGVKRKKKLFSIGESTELKSAFT